MECMNQFYVELKNLKMKKHLKIILLLIFFTPLTSVFGQSSTKEIQNLLDSSDVYLHRDIEKSLEFAKQSSLKAEKIKNQRLKGDSYL